MKIKFFFLFLFVFVIVLQGCAKVECKSDEDCLKPHFNSVCIDNKCVHTPIPDECGNGLCEPGENKCNCEVDCGMCAGISGPFKLSCVNGECLENIPESDVEEVVSLSDLSAGGDQFELVTTFNQPFNVYKDLFNVQIKLNMKVYDNNFDRKITNIKLIGKKDRQSIPLANLDINRNIWPYSKVNADLILDFPASEQSGTFTDLELHVSYDYMTGKTTRVPKSIVMKKTYRNYKLDWVLPSKPYPCPASCDDNNPGTLDVCDKSTDFRCVHRPIPGACGNFICDESENPCTCPLDCGPCDETFGTYMQFACVDNKCIAQTKSAVSQSPTSLFDDRNLNKFHLQNNYNFVDPFNVNSDKISLEFNLYDKQESVSDIKITAVRLFEGSNELTSTTSVLSLSDSGVIDLRLLKQAIPEQAVTLTLKVWYEYTENDEIKKGSYSKPLGRVTVLSPGIEK